MHACYIGGVSPASPATVGSSKNCLLLLFCCCCCCLDRKIEYLHGNVNVPIFDKTSDGFSARAIIELLLDKTLPPSKIATAQPVCVEDNMVFIVDVTKLAKPEDIRTDDLGSWNCNGKRCSWCVLDDDGSVLEIFTKRKSRSPNTYCLVKRYYKHATSGDFKRMIVEVYGTYV